MPRFLDAVLERESDWLDIVRAKATRTVKREAASKSEATMFLQMLGIDAETLAQEHDVRSAGFDDRSQAARRRRRRNPNAQ